MLVGIDPAIGVAAAGTLDPLTDVESTGRAVLNNTATDRLDVRALDDERRSLSARADALRRARLPNPSLVAFAQNDGFNERVFGGGISIPLPLPAPVGRVFTGEIAEAEAAAARCEERWSKTRSPT
jgi:outer membrane protein, heavy metal efflux system